MTRIWLMMSTRTNRWRPRFSLRVFLVAFTLASLWLGWRVSTIRDEQRAVAEIQSAGGFVDYPRYQMVRLPSGKLEHRNVPRRSFWRLVLFGHRDVDRPDYVSFGYTRPASRPVAGVDPSDVDDELLRRVAPAINRLPSVRRLDLSGSQVTEAFGDTIAALLHIQDLKISNPPLSNEKAARLAEIFAEASHLETIDFGMTTIRAADGKTVQEALAEFARLEPPFSIESAGFCY